MAQSKAKCQDHEDSSQVSLFRRPDYKVSMNCCRHFVNWLSERLLEKISELLIDKEEGGGGEERLLWEKMLLTVIKFACLTSQTLRQIKKSINI